MKTLLMILYLALCSHVSYGDGAEKRVKLKREKTTKILDVFKVNEDLLMSFFNYNEEDILRDKEKLSQSLGKVPQGIIDTEIKQIKVSLIEIKKENKKLKNYAAYHVISEVLAKVVEKYDLGGTYNVYYCPMIKKKWVQNSLNLKKVYNPFAPEMPHCGGQLTEFK